MKLIKSISIIFLVICGIFFVGFNLYSLILNKSNHTGFDTSQFTHFFVLLMIILAVMQIVSFIIYKRLDKIAFLGLILCAICIINVVLYEKLNLMMSYELWIKKGMPGK